MAITINQNDNQLISISNNNTQEIGINQNDNQLINIENSNTQDINLRQNENQLILIDGGGNIVGITDVLVNGVTVVSGNIAYITVPTKTSELQNNSGFITNETDPTVPSYIKQISKADINNWNNKQNALVSGSNIKTINNESLLGSGNIEVGGANYSAGTGINIDNENVISNTITSYEDLTDLPIIPTKTSELINDNHFIDGSTLSEVAYSGDYNDLNNLPEIPQNTSELVNDSDFVNSSEVSTEIQTAIATKQDTLVSGTNIKTINNNSLLGSGNLQLNGIGCWYAYGSITWSSTWSWEKIPIWGTIYDNANFILYSNGIYIPAGVTLIKITVNCSIYNVDCGGDKNLAIYKNGILQRSIAYVNYDTTNKYVNMGGQTILNVAQSDEISVQLNSELAGTMRIFDSTIFTIEILG